MTAGVLLIRLTQMSDPAVSPQLGAGLVTGSMFLGLFAAAATGWLRTGRIEDQWRRGVTAAVSVFGAAILAVLATAADSIGGLAGLTGYLVVLVGGAVLAHRAAGHMARQ